MLRRALLALFAVALASPALAQTAPFVYPVAVGLAQVQAIPANNARKRIIFFNPNAVAKVAVCPALRRDTGAAVTCAINGAGSVTLLPYGSFTIDSGSGGPQIFMPSAWNAISDTGGSNFSVFEFE